MNSPLDNDDRTVAKPGASPRELSNTNALQLGTKLGEFELTDHIGEGGFSIVYLAWDHSLECKVALKEYMPWSIATRGRDTLVRPRLERDREPFEAGLKSFINEAKLLRQFDHPSLVKVYRFWEANGTAYMVMPFYDGMTLKDTLRALAQPPDEAWLIALLTPLTEALAVIHAKQCYHRDIAPDNVILLAGSGKPLLLDFGAARRVVGDLTQALTVILKPGYAPVEQYAEVPGMKQGPWTDIYALAAVVYRMVSGKTPQPAVGRMLSDRLVPLAECAAGRYSTRFLLAIDRALAVLPEHRTQSMAAFRLDIGLNAQEGDPEASIIRSMEQPAKAIAASVTRTEPATAQLWRTQALSPGNHAATAGTRIRTLLGIAFFGAALMGVGGVSWVLLRYAEPSPPEAEAAGTSIARPAAPATSLAAQEAHVPPRSQLGIAAPDTPPDTSPMPAAEQAVVTPVVEATRPKHARALPVAIKEKPARRADGSDNSARCARLFQRISLGESSPELMERVKELNCR